MIGAAGGTTVTGERVTGIEVRGEEVTVVAESGARWQAPRLVVAAGGWSAKLLAEVGLELPLTITQEQLAFFPARDGLDHRASAMPVFIDYHAPDPFYGLPQIVVPGVKVGWHHRGQPIDADEPKPFDEENLAAVQRYVAERLPHLDTRYVERLTCLYTNTPDYHFILDRHPTLPNVIIGTGFSGHGFKFGPVLGESLAALALDEPPPVPLDMFALSRFAWVERLARRTNA